MSRHATGLRNRYRPRGRSAYARKGKGATADYYGEWERGRQITPDKIRKREPVGTPG